MKKMQITISVTSTEAERSLVMRFLHFAHKVCFSRNDIAILLLVLINVACSEFNAVKAPSVEIAKSDNTADCCSVVMTAGRYGIIRYTTDGTNPTVRSAVYTDEIYLPTGTSLTAASFCPGGRRSEIVTTVIEIPTDQSKNVMINADYCTVSDSE